MSWDFLGRSTDEILSLSKSSQGLYDTEHGAHASNDLHPRTTLLSEYHICFLTMLRRRSVFCVLASSFTVETFQKAFRRLPAEYFLTPRVGPACQRFAIVVKRQDSFIRFHWVPGSTLFLVLKCRIRYKPIESRKGAIKEIQVNTLFDSPSAASDVSKNSLHWCMTFIQ